MGRTRSDAMDSLLTEEGPIGQSITSSTQEEQAEDETKPEIQGATICGMDERPAFPTALVGSLVLGALCMFTVQRSLTEEFFGGAGHFTRLWLLLYFVALASTAYTGLADPGMMTKEDHAKWQSGQLPTPKRANKCWLYKRPVLRFDHYCRWVTNVIGLNNHREFMIMCGSLVAISTLGVAVDSVLLLCCLAHGQLFEPLLTFHLLFSVYFAKYAVEVFRIHVGFVSRNELAREWKNDEYYVVIDEETGRKTAAKDLDEEEYNAYFDANAFQYDAARNPFDRGVSANCWGFWCNPRWSSGQLGEF